MREYALQLEKYGISQKRYKELLYLCRQYDDMRKKLSRIRAGWDDGRTGCGKSSVVADPTGNRAAKVVDSWCAHRINCIEQAAILAAPDLCKYILNNVTRGVRYEEMPVPCGINQFYRARRGFFVELDQLI